MVTSSEESRDRDPLLPALLNCEPLQKPLRWIDNATGFQKQYVYRPERAKGGMETEQLSYAGAELMNVSCFKCGEPMRLFRQRHWEPIISVYARSKE
jgi:hypothetical protein